MRSDGLYAIPVEELWVDRRQCALVQMEGRHAVSLTRRQFLKGMSITAGGIGLTASGYNQLIPFIHQPNDIVPGASTWFATSCRECPAGCSMIVRNRDARVVKCEGNPNSPVNGGKLCARGQAAPYGLYDPDRITGPLRRGKSGKLEPVSWDDALKVLGGVLRPRPRIALITDLQTGTLDALMHTWLTAFGSGRLITYEPIDYAAVKAVNGGVVPTFNIAQSDYLISFAADFLETWISPVEYAREFTTMRQVRDGTRSGFVYVGPRVSATAVNADHRMIVPPGYEEAVASAIVSQSPADIPGVDQRTLGVIAQELARAKAPLALPGLNDVQARAAARINSARGSSLIDPSRPQALTNTSSASEMESLISDMEADRVDMLIVHGANPVFTLPDSGRFVQALKQVKSIVSLSSFMDETTVHANWVLPSNTPLESWGDYSPYPGVTNITQPAMGLICDTRHTGDILIGLAQSAGVDPVSEFKAGSFYEYLRRRWGFPLTSHETADTPSPGWEALVQQGGRFTSTRSKGAPTGGTTPPAGTGTAAMPGAVADGEIRLHAFPHPYYYDGRNANRRWLQEMPEPVTKAVWGTWAEIHPQTAQKLGVRTDDVIELSSGSTTMRIPAYVWEGIAPDTVAVPIGEGHTDYGRFASGVGVNVYPLAGMNGRPVKISKTPAGQWAPRIKGSTDQQGRGIVQTVALDKAFRREKEIIMPMPSGYTFNDFYPGHEHVKHRWAMVVDLDRCIGCHACVTACYAENNVGIVGPDEIYRRREMSWLRIDRYIDWKNQQSPILFQPMLCQHCDAAPCEPVCPVYASAHSDEGLNMQIYNRCVGTRYCSNNCPYKVRRFNWYDYQWPTPLNWQLNPDVTVRCRGVMEKCTFCIQRIREAEIIATRENRQLRDGEVTPACAQTCPTGVFTFGDLMDPDSRVSKIINTDPRAYQVLAVLNTKPAVIYLKRIVQTA